MSVFQLKSGNLCQLMSTQSAVFQKDSNIAILPENFDVVP